MSKTALITGSSRGLGRALALVFARGGYDVIIHGRNKERLNDVVAELWECKVEIQVIEGDLTDKKTIEALAEAAKARNLDVLINNAGVYLAKDITDVDDDELREVIETNLIAPMLLSKKIFGPFFQSKSGIVININSTAGKTPADKESVYCASKHGLRGFSTSSQRVGTDNNVRIIDIYLGAMQTDMTAKREDFSKLIAPDEVADAIYHLTQNYETLRIMEVKIGRQNY